jgi:4-methyl-5(b-hydroxyethyl)-thiazole monophosphate biosynthesis
MARAIIFFAQGLEECEGLIVVDILRRAHVDVDIAAVGGKRTITSSHGVVVTCDILAEDASPADYDAVILPGGMPGTTNLQESPVVRDFVLAMDKAGKLVCAICAAPGALASFGVLKGEPASVYPGCEPNLEAGGATCTGDAVTVCGTHITGQAMGAAIPFGLEIASHLVGKKESDRVRTSIVYRG